MHEYHHMDSVFNHSNGNCLYVGDATAAEDIENLKKHKVRTVITAAEGFQFKYDSSIRHITYPLRDHKNENVLKILDEVANNIDKCLKYGSILVHCGAGVSRSTTLAIAYLIKYQGLNFLDALRKVKTARPQVCPNLGFELQLKSYYLFLNQKPDNRIAKQVGLLCAQLPQISKQPSLRDRKGLNFAQKPIHSNQAPLSLGIISYNQSALGVRSPIHAYSHLSQNQSELTPPSNTKQKGKLVRGISNMSRSTYYNPSMAKQSEYLRRIAEFRFGLTNTEKWKIQ